MVLPREPEELDRLTWLFTRLLVLSEERGPHATGAAWLDLDGEHRLFKLPGTAEQFIMNKAYHELIAGVSNRTTVLIGHNRWRIRTKISAGGSTIEAKDCDWIGKRDRLTRQKRWEQLDDDLTYDANALDRDVVAPDQIRTIVRTYRDKLATEIFPGRDDVPKTLIFAKDDSHADDIVQIIREEFARGNDFCWKLTYRTTGKKPDDLLAEFRNSYNPRILVTVDMIATGTDVKPLEVVMFMRTVRILRDDGLSYGDYVEQLTYLLFLKMAHERTESPWNLASHVPEGYDWPSIVARDGVELETGANIFRAAAVLRARIGAGKPFGAGFYALGQGGGAVLRWMRRSAEEILTSERIRPIILRPLTIFGS